MTSDPMNDEPPESEASSSGTGPNAAVRQRLAVKGHEVASGLRGERTEESGTGPHGPSAPEPEHPASEEGPPPAP